MKCPDKNKSSENNNYDQESKKEGSQEKNNKAGSGQESDRYLLMIDEFLTKSKPESRFCPEQQIQSIEAFQFLKLPEE